MARKSKPKPAPQPSSSEPRSWPADKTERWPIERIHPYPRNARTHSEEQIDLIAASMQKYGVTAPLLVDEDGVLIYGHGRLRAAQKLALTDLPVSVAVGWSEEDKAAYRIADNQIALRSDWNMELLTAEVKELSYGEYDLGLLGFPEQQLEWMSEGGQLGSDPVAEWAQSGMPGFQMGNKRAFRSVIVHLKDEAALEEFQKLIGQKIRPKAKFIWHPEMEVEAGHDKLWVGAEDEA